MSIKVLAIKNRIRVLNNDGYRHPSNKKEDIHSLSFMYYQYVDLNIRFYTIRSYPAIKHVEHKIRDKLDHIPDQNSDPNIVSEFILIEQSLPFSQLTALSMGTRYHLCPVSTKFLICHP